MQNLHQLFDWHYIGQIIGGDFAKFCGSLTIYELYEAKLPERNIKVYEVFSDYLTFITIT